MIIKESFRAFGHAQIQGIHPTTLMFTKDAHLTQTGDCIVAVAAVNGMADLSPEFKNKLKTSNSKLTIVIQAGDLKEQINASGSTNLVLTHPTDMVVRRSNYICNRTLAINADKSSNDLHRAFIEKLKDPKQEIKITLIVES